MLKAMVIGGLAAILCGCAGMQYVMDEYRGVDMREVAMTDDVYRVFDRPDRGKMMVTSSMGSAVGQGLGKGLLFGAVETTPPKPLFEAAAAEFLRQTDRASCRIVDGYLLIQPQFEFKYDCVAAVAAAPQAAPVRRRR